MNSRLFASRRLPLVLSLLFASLWMFSAPAQAGDIGNAKNYGFGLVGGSSTVGLTAKVYLSPTRAVQGSVGMHHLGGFGFGVDGVQDMQNLVKWSHSRIMWGLGGGLDLWWHVVSRKVWSAVGLHAVGQVSWHMEDWPVEAVVDWHPGWYFGGAPVSGISLLEVGLSLRWYL